MQNSKYSTDCELGVERLVREMGEGELDEWLDRGAFRRGVGEWEAQPQEQQAGGNLRGFGEK